MISIYINIATINNFNSVLSELLNKIDISGLYEASYKIYLTVNGEPSLLNINNKDKYHIWQTGYNTKVVEFPSLYLLWKHAQQSKENYKILYLHTKGITKPNSEPVKDWVDYMSYFNIEKWQNRLDELDEYDTTGVNLQGNMDDFKESPMEWGITKKPKHYSGNFWWANSNYIKKLNNPFDYPPDDNFIKWRVMCEMWLCQNNGNFNSAFNSGVNHYLKNFKKNKYS